LPWRETFGVEGAGRRFDSPPRVGLNGPVVLMKGG
jgi:hypothetical protein